MFTPSKPAIDALATFLVIIHVSSCNGELPPYIDPGNLFQARTSGLYVLSSQENTLKVIVTVINKFDETLDGEAILDGSVKITLGRFVQYEKNVSIGPSNLIQARSYNPSTRHLTIDPGDSIRFMYSWNFVDDLGRDLRQQVFQYIRDTTCVLTDRRIAVKETFFLSGKVNVFSRTSIAISQTVDYNVCHVNIWVLSNICPPVLPQFCR